MVGDRLKVREKLMGNLPGDTCSKVSEMFLGWDKGTGTGVRWEEEGVPLLRV